VRYSKLKAKLETTLERLRKRSSRSRTRFPPTSCRGVLVPHRSRATTAALVQAVVGGGGDDALAIE